VKNTFRRHEDRFEQQEENLHAVKDKAHLLLLMFIILISISYPWLQLWSSEKYTTSLNHTIFERLNETKMKIQNMQQEINSLRKRLIHSSKSQQESLRHHENPGQKWHVSDYCLPPLNEERIWHILEWQELYKNLFRALRDQFNHSLQWEHKEISERKLHSSQSNRTNQPQVPVSQCSVAKNLLVLMMMSIDKFNLDPGELIQSANAFCSQRELRFVNDVIMFNFEETREKVLFWETPCMYTHIGGYKFVFRIYPNGIENFYRGVYISIHAVEGEFDANLRWPAKVKLKIALVGSLGKRSKLLQKFFLTGIVLNLLQAYF